MSDPVVDICVITYKRPRLLERLLKSIIHTHLSGPVPFRIIVVDNDKERSAAAIVSSLAKQYKDLIHYDIEPEKSYSKARNRCLELSEAENLVFIDDDEWVDASWLESLISVQKTYDAALVFGPSVPIMPEKTPTWIIQGRFFEDRDSYNNGEQVPSGSSANVLIHKKHISGTELRFSARFGATGGEDHELFSRLYHSGNKMVWADKAVAYEEIIDEKLNFKWIMKRAYRSGDTFAKVHCAHITPGEKIIWYTKKFIHLIVSAILTPVLYIKGKGYGLRMASRVVSNYASLYTIFSTSEKNQTIG